MKDPLGDYSNVVSRIYLFAHQDDEIGCLPLLRRDISSGIDVHCIYVADGGNNTKIRDKETKRMLSFLGLNEIKLSLWSDKGFKELSLHKYLSRILGEIEEYLKKNNIGSCDIVTLDYEGGHPDHDAIWVVAQKLKNKKLVSNIYSFSLYHSGYLKVPLFTCGLLLRSGRTLFKAKCSLREQLLALIAFYFYPSQKKTWFGLMPFLLFSLLKNRGLSYCEHNDDISLGLKRPHEGPLLIEHRFIKEYDSYFRDLNNFWIGIC